ncbi:peptidyl-prolyl cis-trans isomerase [Thalassotalea sp. HSM 43]|uniref:peptidyl-prolyl cis-trans isomerase n=1 Tax=Thalassotalea sp. HSM 43 TaxID=2552945 RepID=UPI00107FFD96|nr:peptidyl-prolyl cis-trans isomerase [Thalassotalea sp. HSM 43]QBY05500.1 peptidyl-prolyl cis-trans isomerase [Thalassotalea sp. HSM 43]
MMITKLIRQPLVHFLFLGAVIYWLFEDISAQQQDTIVIDKQGLLTFMQYRYQAFEPGQAEQNLSKLSATQKQQLIDEYTQQEALYRQALKMNLDKNDYIIKKRLIQKMEFIAEDISASSPPEPQSLQAYFIEHQDEYRQPEFITFSHQYFSDKNTRSSLSADARAQQAMAMLNAKVNGHKAIEQDLFMYNRHYAERPKSLIMNHFGPLFTEQIFAQTIVDDANWQGPYQSAHGWHIVKVFKRQAARSPEFNEVKAQVTEDFIRQQKNKDKRAAINDIVEQFHTKVDL